MKKLLLPLIVVAATGVLASSAMAASQISGCFSYNGVRYNGLTTLVQYRTTSGGWVAVRGSGSWTRGHGCITYNISGVTRSYYLRIKALAMATNRTGFFVGSTPYYSGGGNGTYNLGAGRMSFYRLPSYVASPSSTNITSSWIDQMATSCGPGASPAMQVACYMDQNGLHGNVVTPFYYWSS